LDEVKEALRGIGVEGMTISKCAATADRRVTRKFIVARSTMSTCCRRSNWSWVVAADRADEVIKALTQAARTGKIGDGKLSFTMWRKPSGYENDDRGEAAL